MDSEKKNPHAAEVKKRRLEAVQGQQSNFRRIISTLEGHTNPVTKATTVHIPGHDLLSFDRTANLGFYSISRMIELDRLMDVSNGKYETCFKMFLSKKDLLAVVAAHELHVSKEMYTNASLVRPMVYESKLGYVGTTSLSCIATYHDEKTGKQLLISEIHLAIRNSATNKPWVIEDETRQQYKISVTKEKTAIPHPPKRPQQTFKYKILVRHSDHDKLFHVNQGSFISFCLDCATEASLAGFYPGFHGDIAWYHVKDAYVIYRGESFAGDVLNVVTWEGSNYSVHFEIEKADDVILHCTLVFYKDIGPLPQKL